MKKLIALMLVSVLGVATLSGCTSKKDENTSTDTQVTESGEARTDIVFANYRDIRDPNPHLYQGEMWFQEMVYETLVS